MSSFFGAPKEVSNRIFSTNSPTCYLKINHCYSDWDLKKNEKKTCTFTRILFLMTSVLFFFFFFFVKAYQGGCGATDISLCRTRAGRGCSWHVLKGGGDCQPDENNTLRVGQQGFQGGGQCPPFQWTPRDKHHLLICSCNGEVQPCSFVSLSISGKQKKVLGSK